MSKTISPGARRLSSYPYRKILLTCARCNLRVQYDRDALLMAGGDRGIPDFLTQVAERNGCPALSRGADVYDRCLLKLPELR